MEKWFYSIDFGQGYPAISGQHASVSAFVSVLTDAEINRIMTEDGLNPIGSIQRMPLIESDRDLEALQGDIYYTMDKLNRLSMYLYFSPDDERTISIHSDLRGKLDQKIKNLIKIFLESRNMTAEVKAEIQRTGRYGY